METCLRTSELAFYKKLFDWKPNNLAFKVKIVAEAEAVENNSEIAREYGISDSMVPLEERSGKSVQWGAYRGAYPELDQRLLAWFSEQRSQGEIFPLMHTVFLLGKCRFKQESTSAFVSSLLWCHVPSLFTPLFTPSVSIAGAISSLASFEGKNRLGAVFRRKS